MKPRRTSSTDIRVSCGVENLAAPKRALVASVLVDQCSTFTWLPASTLRGIGIAPRKEGVRIPLSGGRIVTRSVGFAILHVENLETVDEVVFAAKEDVLVLGCRALEGLNLRVDPRNKRLVAGGHKIAAPGAHRRNLKRSPV